MNEYIVWLNNPVNDDALTVTVWARTEEDAMWTAMTRNPDYVAVSADWTGASIRY